MAWERKKISQTEISRYLQDKYPEAKIICFKKLKKVKGLNYKPLLQNDFGMNNDCTLTALTTIICGMFNEEPQKVYNIVEKYAKQYGYNGNGTIPLFIKSIFDKTLKELGINKKTDVDYLKSLGYGFKKVQSLIDNNRPMVLSAFKDGRDYYCNHTIAVIGYALYQVDDSVEPFLLVYDNWNPRICAVDFKILSMISSINYPRQ